MLRRIGNGSQILKNCKRGRLLVTSKNVFLNSCLVPMVCTKETISSVPTGQKSQKIPTKKLIGQKEAEKFIPEKKKQLSRARQYKRNKINVCTAEICLTVALGYAGPRFAFVIPQFFIKQLKYTRRSMITQANENSCRKQTSNQSKVNKNHFILVTYLNVRLLLLI